MHASPHVHRTGAARRWLSEKGDIVALVRERASFEAARRSCSRHRNTELAERRSGATPPPSSRTSPVSCPRRQRCAWRSANPQGAPIKLAERENAELIVIAVPTGVQAPPLMGNPAMEPLGKR
jgi:hypothetical protein